MTISLEVQSSLITLDGTGSFATNAGATIVSYSWIQTSGTAVSLNGANTARPTFTAPTVNGTLAFSLTATAHHHVSMQRKNSSTSYLIMVKLNLRFKRT